MSRRAKDYTPFVTEFTLIKSFHAQGEDVVKRLNVMFEGFPDRNDRIRMFCDFAGIPTRDVCTPEVYFEIPVHLLSGS